MTIQPRNGYIHVQFNQPESVLHLPDSAKGAGFKTEDLPGLFKVLAVAPDVTCCAASDMILLHPSHNPFNLSQNPLTFLVHSQSVLGVFASAQASNN